MIVCFNAIQASDEYLGRELFLLCTFINLIMTKIKLLKCFYFDGYLCTLLNPVELQNLSEQVIKVVVLLTRGNEGIIVMYLVVGVDGK